MPNSPKKSILVVDDSHMMLKIYENQFKNSPFLQSFEMIKCSSPQECIDSLEVMDNLPSAIILDWIMPGPMDGLGLLDYLKKNKNYSHLPVMMVSSVSDKAKIVKVMKYGVKDYLIKPINTSQLINKLLSLANREENIAA